MTRSRLAMRDEDIEIAQHQRRFGHDADRMAGALQHFEDAPHDLIAPLDRLIGIGIGADGDDLRHVARRRQFALQQFRRVRLHEQFGFEIEPRRQAEIGVRRPREAIDAAVLAAAIGIDRTVERNVGRVVAGDDLAGGVDRHRGLERRQFVERLPAVVEGDARQRLETAGRIRHVPRPRRRSRSTAVPSNSPAGAEGSGAGGRLKADDALIAFQNSRLTTPVWEANARM